MRTTMKKITAILFIAFWIFPALSRATDYTDTDQVYGWNTGTSAQFWQTWADHKTQLGLTFAAKTNIAFDAAALSDMTILGTTDDCEDTIEGVYYKIVSVGDTTWTTCGGPASPSIGSGFTATAGECTGTGTVSPYWPIVSDTISPGDVDDHLRVATVERIAELYAPLTSATLTTPIIVDSSTLTFDESAADPNDADVALSATDGKFKIASVNGANNEDIVIDTDITSNSVVISSTTGATKLDFSALNLVTTGTIQAGIVIISDADGMSESEMTVAGMYGTLFLATGAGTWTLPTAVAGMSGCLRDTGTNHDLILDVQAGDDFSLLGVEDTNGDGVTNAATTTTGDMICFVATSNGHWMSMGTTGAWTAQ